MRAEIITIGEEILSGQTVDTNSAFIARQLATIGVEVVWKTSVGDRTDDIATAIKTAWQRANVTICTGGLGPTADDITKKAICVAFERKLVLRDEILQELERRFAARGARMPALTQNQALQPQGAELAPNRVGSAVGIVFRDTDRYFVALPGVPAEMRVIMVEEVIPQLAALPGREHIELRLIRTAGIFESKISEMIGDLQPTTDDLRLAYLPDYRGVDVRVTGKGADGSKVGRSVDELASAIVARLGDYVFTVGEQTLPEIVGGLLLDRRLTISTAESCTGGYLAKILTDISGSSGYFLGSVVAYSNDVKKKILRVPAKMLDTYGAVSSQVAEAMALGVQRLTGSDFALSTTGIAGPTGGTPEKPVGLVYVGLADSEGVKAHKLNLVGTRERVRERSCVMALDILRRKILGIS